MSSCVLVCSRVGFSILGIQDHYWQAGTGLHGCAHSCWCPASEVRAGWEGSRLWLVCQAMALGQQRGGQGCGCAMPAQARP